MTKGLLKSSKKKQKLYDKFLKKKTFSNEKIYKTYKNLFEIIKFKSKKKKNTIQILLQNRKIISKKQGCN